MAKSGNNPEMIEIFKQEAQKHLTKVNNLLLAVEKQGARSDLLDQIKSEVHTLKGDARMMGFKAISAAAHALEDLFEILVKDSKLSSSKLFKNIFTVIDRISDAVTVLPELIEIDISVLQADISSDSKEQEKKGIELFAEQEKQDKQKKKTKSGITQSKEKLPEQSGEKKEYIQVNLTKVEELLNISSTITEYHGRFDYIHRHLSDLQSFAQERHINDDMQKSLETILYNFSHELAFYDLQTKYLQDEVTKLKLVPLSTIFSLFPRLVRDVAENTGKRINFIMSGEDVELDKSLVERLKSILIHILRNAVDHGCETEKDRVKNHKPPENTVMLKAYNRGDMVSIEVNDDGSGLDTKKIKENAIKKNLVTQSAADAMTDDEIISFIFTAGFSTKEVGTFSGRGVGMDVVAGIINELNGDIEVHSTPGKGTTFIISVPLISSFIPLTVFSLQNTLYSIPSSYVVSVIYAREDEINYVSNSVTTINFKNMDVTLIDLFSFFNPGAESGNGLDKKLNIILVSHQDEMTGFIVSDVIMNKKMIIKKIQALADKLQIILGAVMGSEQAIPVLNVPALFDRLKIQSGSSTIKKRKRESAGSHRAWQKIVLLVEDSPVTRGQEKNLLEQQHLYVVEAANGREAVAVLEKQQVDMIVTDIEMPVMNGIELIKYVFENEKFRQIPLLVVSSYTTYFDELSKMGVKYFLDKGNFKSPRIIEILKQEQMI